MRKVHIAIDVFSFAVSAQEKIEISTAPPPAMAPIIVLKEGGQAKITFNERKDEAVARTSFLPVYGYPPNGGIGISARFTSQGKKLQNLRKFSLVFRHRLKIELMLTTVQLKFF